MFFSPLSLSLSFFDAVVYMAAQVYTAAALYTAAQVYTAAAVSISSPIYTATTVDIAAQVYTAAAVNSALYYHLLMHIHLFSDSMCEILDLSSKD